jgi:hypothetical protein
MPTHQFQYEGNYEIAMNDTALYFSDSSWKKLASMYTCTPMVTVVTSAEDSTASSIKSEGFAELQKIGYIYCGGPCNTSKVSKIASMMLVHWRLSVTTLYSLGLKWRLLETGSPGRCIQQAVP